VTGELHRDRVRDTRPDEIAYSRAAKIVRDLPRAAGGLARLARDAQTARLFRLELMKRLGCAVMKDRETDLLR
jgi:hypothetical protein